MASAFVATRLLVLRRVLARTCPQCGRGALFAGYARLARACPTCALVYRREPGAQTGTMYLTAIVGELFAAALIFLFWWRFDWSVRTYVLVLVPLVVAFSALFLPMAQALWVGVEYLTDLEGGEPWTRLRN
ncbi:MAG TPA: DUF983 domain-containing protein [Planctomycetota bacterium]